MIPIGEQGTMEAFLLEQCIKNGWTLLSSRFREFVGRRPVDRLEFDIIVDGETACYHSVFVGLGIRNRLRWCDGPRIESVEDMIAIWNRNAEQAQRRAYRDDDSQYNRESE